MKKMDAFLYEKHGNQSKRSILKKDKMKQTASYPRIKNI